MRKFERWIARRFSLQRVPGEKRARPKTNQRTGPGRHIIRDRGRPEHDGPSRSRLAAGQEMPELGHGVGHNLAADVGIDKVARGSIMRQFLLLRSSWLAAAIAATSVTYSTPGELYPRELEPEDPMGRPWPTYSEALAGLTPCDLIAVSRGTCSDGKQFLERNGGYTVQTRYYDGERLVGMTSFRRKPSFRPHLDRAGAGQWRSRVMARTGHRSSQMVNRYRRIATSLAELNSANSPTRPQQSEAGAARLAGQGGPRPGPAGLGQMS
jgi:hypothetical protein